MSEYKRHIHDEQTNKQAAQQSPSKLVFHHESIRLEAHVLLQLVLSVFLL
jgi:hypothetical protein